MGLKNFFKRIVIEALTEVLEPRIRATVREIVREEIRQLEPYIRAIVREEMRAAFEQEWEPRIRMIVREEIRVAMETEWVPRLQMMWRDDINRLSDRFSSRFDAVQNRLDTLSDMIVAAVQLMTKAREELAEEVRSLRADVERIKAHIGLTGGERI
ncbi:MAG: hypothetical protein LM632_00145 [Armatimonadetes bacterium]|nr:hypothetical protein [Armatimonadota bacterium]